MKARSEKFLSNLAEKPDRPSGSVFCILKFPKNVFIGLVMGADL